MNAMLLSEAQALLDLPSIEGLSQSDLRRAYHRKAKLHDPELNLEGFKNVRAAFERLKDLVDQPWRAHFTDRHFEGSDPSPDPMSEFRARYYEIDPERPDRLSALAREALDRYPNSEEALLWLFEAVDAMDAVQSWQVLQQGVAAGHRSFLLELARRAPQQLTDENLASLEQNASASEFLLLAQVELARGRFDQVPSKLGMAGLAAQTHGASHGLIPGAIDVVLALYEARQEEAARLAKQVVQVVIGAPGHALSELGHETPVKMAVLDELEALGKTIGAEEKALIASGFKQGGFAAARTAMQARLAQRPVYRSEFFAKAKTIATLLQLNETFPTSDRSFRMPWHRGIPIWEVAAGALVLLKCMSHHIDFQCAPTGATRPSTKTPDPAVAFSVADERARATSAELQAFCFDKKDLACSKLVGILNDARTSRCDQAQAAATSFEIQALDADERWRRLADRALTDAMDLCDAKASLRSR